MKHSPTETGLETEPTEDGAEQEQITANIKPFFDLLYEEGAPSAAQEDADEESQTPLYDTLRNLDTRYTEQTLIATGGMKEIYRALDRRTSRYVAIARPLSSHGKDYYDAFLREAHITARLEHPGIIKLFGMDVDEDGRPFFTMELKTGRSLRELIKEQTEGERPSSWSLLQRLKITLRICESLAYAHSQRVLHLDIKPENIQIGSFGEVQLCDWGMGVVMQDGENHQSDTLLDPDLYGSLQREIKGTPSYMAPELFDAKHIKTPQMDIYSLGCLMEELIQAPEPGAAKSALLPASSPLNQVIRKAKAKHPAQRYQSVAEIQQDISRFIEGYIMSVEDSSLLRESRLFYQRNRFACNITLAFLLLSVAAATLFLSSLNKSRNEAYAAKDRAVEAMEALGKAKLLSETRLKNQATAAQKETSQLISLAFVEQVSLETLADLLHSRLDAVIENNPPETAYIWVEKFWLDFLTQRFEHAIQLNVKERRALLDLLPLAKKYSARMGNAEYLAVADFKELLTDLFQIKDIPRIKLAEKMIRYDLKNPRSTEDRVEIIRCMLQNLNPDWKPQIFEYSPTDRSIRLGGKGLTRLTTGKKQLCLLSLIAPRKLDLRDTSIRSLEELNSLDLSEIDLRQSPVKSLQPLAKMKHLSRVTISPAQLPAKESASLPAYLEIRVEQ